MAGAWRASAARFELQRSKTTRFGSHRMALGRQLLLCPETEWARRRMGRRLWAARRLFDQPVVAFDALQMRAAALWLQHNRSRCPAAINRVRRGPSSSDQGGVGLDLSRLCSLD